MRLIDADALIKIFEVLRDEHETHSISYNALYEVLVQQPTAYSVDKVVEEFEKIRAKETCNKEKCDTKEICRICVVDDAIKIVKQGCVGKDVSK